jgi:hypothetical protein
LKPAAAGNLRREILASTTEITSRLKEADPATEAATIELKVSTNDV